MTQKYDLSCWMPPGYRSPESLDDPLNLERLSAAERKRALSQLHAVIEELCSGRRLYFGDILLDEKGKPDDKRIHHFVNELLSHHTHYNYSAFKTIQSSTEVQRSLYRNFYLCCVYYLLSQCPPDDWIILNLERLADTAEPDSANYRRPKQIPFRATAFSILIQDVAEHAATHPPKNPLVKKCILSYEIAEGITRAYGLSFCSAAAKDGIHNYLTARKASLSADSDRFYRAARLLNAAARELCSISDRPSLPTTTTPTPPEREETQQEDPS